MSSSERITYLNHASHQAKGAEATFMISTVMQVEAQHCVLNGAVNARQADGLGVQLSVGDQVACLASMDGVFVIALLKAAQQDSVTLNYSHAERLRLVAEHIDVVGRQSVSLRSFRQLSLETCRTIRMSCENLLQSAADSVVSVMTNWVHKCDQGSVEAKDLLRSDAGNQIITANKDMRLDAKRINMG